MFGKRKPVFENVSADKHKEHETRNTRVSEYLRKYGQGKIDTLPTDNRPQVKDNRTTDEMLADPDKLTSSLGTEQLDALLEMQAKYQDFENAIAEIELTKKQKENFDKAISILKNDNSSYEQKMDAYRILEELEKTNKVKRARV